MCIQVERHENDSNLSTSADNTMKWITFDVISVLVAGRSSDGEVNESEWDASFGVLRVGNVITRLNEFTSDTQSPVNMHFEDIWRVINGFNPLTVNSKEKCAPRQG